MEVPFVILNPMHDEIEQELTSAFCRVRSKEQYIISEECNNFEIEFAKYCSSKYAIGCGNGLDAIYLSLRALGIGKGDEVIIPAHTFIATSLAVTYAGATPIFVDNDLESFNIDVNKIEDAISTKTKAIIPVHLYGQMAEMNKIMIIAEKYGIYVIEDAAQAHGATHFGNKAGSYGKASAFSFYPGKNLGALGDAGAIVTNSEPVKDSICMLKNYGSNKRYYHDMQGTNSRLDELQAALLREKLKKLDFWNQERNNIAEKYNSNIKNSSIFLPVTTKGNGHVWHIYSIRCEKRDKLQQYLTQNGITTLIHYPVPIHLQKAYEDLGYKMGDFPISEEIANTQLSLPMFYGITDEQIEYVAKIINKFF